MTGVQTCALPILDNERRHLQALARALPRMDSLFALPRQRFDTASGRLRSALFQNLQRHRAWFGRVSALLRPRVVRTEIERQRESVAELEARLIRGYGGRVQRAKASLDTGARILESVSFQAVLNRGFVLVRGPGGELKRRASAVKPGESLKLRFADAEANAVAAGKDSKAGRAGAQPKPGQADLF